MVLFGSFISQISYLSTSKLIFPENKSLMEISIQMLGDHKIV